MASVLGKKGLWIGTAILVISLGLYFLFAKERSFIPEYSDFIRIRALPYDKQTMNCIHKSIMYSDILKERGWKHWIAIGRVGTEPDEHAWVVVLDKKGVRRLCDPTSTRASGFPETSCREYKVLVYYDDSTQVTP